MFCFIWRFLKTITCVIFIVILIYYFKNKEIEKCFYINIYFSSIENACLFFPLSFRGKRRNFFQFCRNINFLRALRKADSAFRTLMCLSLFSKQTVFHKEIKCIGIFSFGALLIVFCEYFRNMNAGRALHTVSAVGARNF